MRGSGFQSMFSWLHCWAYVKAEQKGTTARKGKEGGVGEREREREREGESHFQ
jgi:hypothetical protein